MIHAERYQLQCLGLVFAPIQRVQDFPGCVNLVPEYPKCCRRIYRGLPLASCGAIGRHHFLEFRRYADVVNHQATRLFTKHPVHPRNGLGEIGTLHGLVNIHGGKAGGIKASKPHVADNHDFQWVCRVLEPVFKGFLLRPSGVMGLQFLLVRSGSCHHHLDGSGSEIIRVPVRAQFHYLAIEASAYFPGHGNNQCLARLCLATGLVMVDEVFRHFLKSGIGANDGFQCRPLASCARLCCLVCGLAIQNFFHSFIQFGQFIWVQLDLCKARLIVDRHGCTVFLRLLNVIDGDILAKDCTGVPIILGNGCAGEGEKGGIRQGIAHGPCKAKLDGPGLAVNFRVKPILRTMRLICNHHYVVTLGEAGEFVLALLQSKLLNGGEDDAARWSVHQLLPQFGTGVDLLWCFPQQLPSIDKHIEQLAIQVLPVCDHDDGGVFQPWFTDQAASKAGHFQALARTLGMPYYATLLVALVLAGCDDAFYSHLHGMKLVIGSDFLGEVLAFLKHAKVA